MNKQPDKPTEQLILAAAEKLFLEKGFALTSTVEIARIAGCNQALVHYYFRTKERLFEAVFEKTAGKVLGVMLEDPEPTVSLEEDWRRRSDRLYEMLKENPGTAFFFFNELNTNPRRLEELATRNSGTFRNLIRKLDERLGEEIEKGTIRPVNATDLLLNVLALSMVVFLALPLLKGLSGMTEQVHREMIDARRRENITVLLKSLRP